MKAITPESLAKISEATFKLWDQMEDTEMGVNDGSLSLDQATTRIDSIIADFTKVTDAL